MKLTICSFAVNNKFPIDLQIHYFNKYYKNDFEFILCNDAYDSNISEELKKIALDNNVKCLNIPQKIHKIQNPSESYGETLNWILHEYALKNNIQVLMMIHTDVFPIRDIYFDKLMENNLLVSTIESRSLNGESIIYLYPALTIIDMRLPNLHTLNFKCCVVNDEIIINNIDFFILQLFKYYFLSCRKII